MTVRPIIMSPRMVLALLHGMKTQTRRLAYSQRKTGVLDHWGRPETRLKPTIWTRAAAGDLLWVRESFVWGEDGANFYFLADNKGCGWPMYNYMKARNRLKSGPSIHMPRCASRLTLELDDVCIERLHGINSDDARAEGVNCWPDYVEGRDDPFPIERYRDLWIALHGVDSWDENPEVVTLVFRVHRQNIDQFQPKAA